MPRMAPLNLEELLMAATRLGPGQDPQALAGLLQRMTGMGGMGFGGVTGGPAGGMGGVVGAAPQVGQVVGPGAVPQAGGAAAAGRAPASLGKWGTKAYDLLNTPGGGRVMNVLGSILAYYALGSIAKTAWGPEQYEGQMPMVAAETARGPRGEAIGPGLMEAGMPDVQGMIAEALLPGAMQGAQAAGAGAMQAGAELPDMYWE